MKQEWHTGPHARILYIGAVLTTELYKIWVSRNWPSWSQPVYTKSFGYRVRKIYPLVYYSELQSLIILTIQSDRKMVHLLAAALKSVFTMNGGSENEYPMCWDKFGAGKLFFSAIYHPCYVSTERLYTGNIWLFWLTNELFQPEHMRKLIPCSVCESVV